MADFQKCTWSRGLRDICCCLYRRSQVSHNSAFGWVLLRYLCPAKLNSTFKLAEVGPMDYSSKVGWATSFLLILPLKKHNSVVSNFILQLSISKFYLGEAADKGKILSVNVPKQLQLWSISSETHFQYCTPSADKEKHAFLALFLKIESKQKSWRTRTVIYFPFFGVRLKRQPGFLKPYRILK